MPEHFVPEHFVVVGAQRCGTTYLYGLLDDHPDIEMAKPLRPEPKFFLDYDQYARGVEYYESQFFSEPGVRVRGEKSTSYIESEVAMRRIHAMLPDAVVVVVLRDPVERAVSNYRFTAQSGVEDLSLADALHAAAGDRPWDRSRFSVSPFDYLARGRYVDYLDRLVCHVPREQLSVVLFEELVANTGVTAALYERLGVDPSFRPPGLGLTANASSANDQPIEPALEAWLRDYFLAPNRQLEQFLGRGLPWAS